MSRAFHAVVTSVALVFVLSGAGCSKKEGFKVTGLEPKVGPYTGGTVTITGSGFQEGGARGVTVYFGNRPAKVLGWVGDDRLKVESPPVDEDMIGQTVDVMLVFDDSGEIKIEQAYTYEDVGGAMNVDSLTEGAEGVPPAPAPGGGATPPAGGTTPPPAGDTPPPAGGQ